MYTTKAAHELYKLQDFYRLLTLCEDREVADEAHRKANEAHRLILRLVDIENALWDMRVDYDKLVKNTRIPDYEVTDSYSGSVLESFPTKALAEAYCKRLKIEDNVAAEIIPRVFSAYNANHWNLDVIWEMEDEVAFDLINQ